MVRTTNDHQIQLQDDILTRSEKFFNVFSKKTKNFFINTETPFNKNGLSYIIMNERLNPKIKKLATHNDNCQSWRRYIFEDGKNVDIGKISFPNAS